MAEQEKPIEGRRRRADLETLGEPEEQLLMLLTPAGILVGWARPDWNEPGATHFGLRLPVQLHQVPMTAEGGQIGLAQLYTAVPADALQVARGLVVGAEVLDGAGDVARLHAQAIRQRAGSALLLARAGGRLAH